MKNQPATRQEDPRQALLHCSSVSSFLPSESSSSYSSSKSLLYVAAVLLRSPSSSLKPWAQLATSVPLGALNCRTVALSDSASYSASGFNNAHVKHFKEVHLLCNAVFNHLLCSLHQWAVFSWGDLCVCAILKLSCAAICCTAILRVILDSLFKATSMGVFICIHVKASIFMVIFNFYTILISHVTKIIR